jgi:hypothetical protein
MKALWIPGALFLLTTWAGCQVIAGLSELETEGAGGTATVGGAGGSDGAGGSGGSGGAEMCMNPGDCSDDGVCDVMQMRCAPCGGTALEVPPMCDMTSCVRLEEAQPGTCMMDADLGDTCFQDAGMLSPGMHTINTMGGPTVITCGDGECTDVQLTCMGPHPCQVRCEDGGCDNLSLTCDNIAPCKVTCSGSDPTTCSGLEVSCGLNSCEVVFEMGLMPTEMPSFSGCMDSCRCDIPMPM